MLIARGQDALRHYVLAGQSKKLEALAGALRDEPVRLAIDLVTPRPWERTVALTLAAAVSDLVVDEDAVQWCGTAFREIIEHPQPAPIGAPNPWLAAFKVFGKLTIVSTEEQARRFLEMSSELIPREPNRYRLTDEAHIEALIGIAQAHPALRAEAIDHLLQSSSPISGWRILFSATQGTSYATTRSEQSRLSRARLRRATSMPPSHSCCRR